MTNQKEHYEQLWLGSLKKFESGKFELDSHIYSKNDNRYGLTLIARPSIKVRKNVSEMLNKIQLIAPGQYYYPVSDMHVTVLSIISCQAGFTLKNIDLPKYTELIKSTIANIGPLNINFQGITASPSAIMICGFPELNALNNIRFKLRETFKQSSLYHTIDQRYFLQTAHITVIRFCRELSNLSAFIQKVQELKDTQFGSCTINELELVGNDWYQRKDKVERIEKFKLQNSTA